MDSKKDGPTTRRRSARQSPKKVLSSDGLHRPPLKRTRKMREDDEDAAKAVNGSKGRKSLTKEDDDGERPVKMQILEEKTMGKNEKGDGLNQTDEADMEIDENEDQDQKINSDEEAEQDQESSLRDLSSLGAVPLENQQEGSRLRNRKIMNYQNQIMEKPKNVSGLGNLNRYPPTESQKSYIYPTIKHPLTNQTTNQKSADVSGLGNLNRYPPTEPQKSYIYPTIKHPLTNQTTNQKSSELKILQKPVTSKSNPASSSRGWMSYMCKLLQWSLILTGLLALSIFGFFACQKFLRSNLPQTDVAHTKIIEKFDPELTALQALFPSQHPLFWKRSGKHLKSHLETVNPTEPVSVILTAGHQAERTLGCLARRLAGVYSATHNASILEIDGTTKSAQDSGQVKLEIDEALKEAFEGDKPAAVVHRFEELPPGSTLIFYRYCDHENAVYKKVFLVFTVMLSRDEIAPTTSLSAVEDMVYDHVKEKFVKSDKSTMFNQMDVDKLSGLWSRISHLILPVAAEEKIEQQGCGA